VQRNVKLQLGRSASAFASCVSFCSCSAPAQPTRAQSRRAQVRATAEQRPEQREWRSHDLPQQACEELPDNRADAEVRVIQAARDRQVEIDHPIAILQERCGQLDRQRYRLFAFRGGAELELVEHHVVLGVECPVLDVVAQLRGELALRDAVTGKFARV